VISSFLDKACAMTSTKPASKPEATPVAVLGGGKIGIAIAHLLGATGDYAVTVIDRDATRLAQATAAGFTTASVDLADPIALMHGLRSVRTAISAAPYFLTESIARAARDAGVAYFDLTEDVASTRQVRAIATDSPTTFMPQCGLAPGAISVIGADLARRFDPVHDVRMRVGALPIYPSNALKYNLTWSTDGLINEYCNPCEAVVEGVLREMPPLEEMEHFSLDGIDYEAFNTSGGLGTLAETLAGRVRTLNYKTVRYPGHRDIMKILIQDLGLGRRRELLKDVLETAVPITMQDVVLVFVTASGMREGLFVQETFARKIYSQHVAGRLLSAIQLTTAAAVCAMADLHREGVLPQSGFVRQEDVPLATFLGNRFGRYYAGETAPDSAHDGQNVRSVLVG
jgi:saccharopine dehydrogenase-like NADP-dependent oxidoreductase